MAAILIHRPLLTLVGFGSGAGGVIAEDFGSSGFRLALVSRHKGERATRLRQLEASGIAFQVFESDVWDAESLTAALVEVAARLGDIDVLIYNPVSASFGKPSSLTASIVSEDFAVNVVGGVVSALTVLPAMRRKRDGAILFIGDGCAIYPCVEAASTSLSKAAMRKLVFALAEELKGPGVRVGMFTIVSEREAKALSFSARVCRAFVEYLLQPETEFEVERFHK